MLASSDGISCWTPLKPQHGNPNPNRLVNQLRCIDFLTPPPLLIIPHRLPAFSYATQKLMLDSCKMLQKQSEAFHTFLWQVFFPSLKQNFIAYRSSKVSSHADCIIEIHQLWQSGFSRLYSNCCCSCFFEPEIITIGQSSYNIYSNNIMKFQESTPLLNAHTKLIVCTSYVLDCNIVVSVFELQSRYYIHFRTNTLDKVKEYPYLQSYI